MPHGSDPVDLSGDAIEAEEGGNDRKHNKNHALIQHNWAPGEY
jgi:hypothetical protein